MSHSPRHFAEYFNILTNHVCWGFQEDIAGLLLKGKSVVFRAPTGSGKTWTTIAPFLFSTYVGQKMADRLIYALPLRSLASTLHKSTIEAISRIHPVSANARERKYPSDQLYCSLQIGGQTNDPFFEGDIVFCTIDQLLSGYLMLPLSMPPRLGNLVAGALAGSYVIFDEAHLLDSRIALGTVIEFLDRFRGLVKFALMTATISDESMEWLANRLGAEAVRIPPDQIRRLPIHENKRRTWQWRGEELTASHVQAAHRGQRTLVIVNRVPRAQELYEEITHDPNLRSTRVACLHSRFFAEDRTRTEASLDRWFGPDASENDVILVTTQVVEAGIDISADQILTELAPMNSLVQRAGRTARYKNAPREL
jgi:CRISPR-associated endonuclease/helicase Cas3